MLCLSGFELYPRWVPLNSHYMETRLEYLNLDIGYRGVKC